MAAFFVSLSAVVLASCGGGAKAEPEPGPAPEPAAYVRPVRDVLDATLAELGVTARSEERLARELRGNEGLLPGESTVESGASDAAAVDDGEDGGSGTTTVVGTNTDATLENPAAQGTASAPSETVLTESSPAELDPELVEMREGLLEMVKGDPRQLAVAQGDFENLGVEVADVLLAGFEAHREDPVSLRFLADFASVVPDARLAQTVMELTASHEEPWLRRYCAWLLGRWSETPGAEAIVPLLVRRLKYERDQEAFVWIGTSLAAFENFAGLSAMFDLANRPDGQPGVEAARVELARIASEAPPKDDGSPRTIGEIAVAWDRGEVGRATPPSDALRGELWRLVADLSGERFQLRGVDDARYVLSRLGPWAGSELGDALEDHDEYVRLHVAQVLERMGARGHQGFESLVLALEDRHAAVAGAAAESLARVAGDARSDAARDALLSRLDATPPYEVRVPITRALGRLRSSVPVARLEEIFADAPASDQKLAAAEGLMAARPSETVLTWVAGRDGGACR